MVSQNSITACGLYSEIALLGVAEILELLTPQEELDSVYSTYTSKNSKNYFFLKVLVQVQQAGYALLRWVELIENTLKDVESKGGSQAIAVELNSLIVEQSVWQRKMVECLSRLICFSTTNDNIYYYHLFLISDLQSHLKLQNEQKDFFHGNSFNREHTINMIKDKITTLESTINDLSKCWYLSSYKPILERKGSGLLINERNLLLKTLGIATTEERTALGYTYELAFAEASRQIHFTTTESFFQNSQSRFEFGIAQCGMLICTILIRSQQLLGIYPKKLSQYLRTFEEDIHKQEPSKIAKIGDFVFAGGLYLGEVLEVQQSIFGYECYRIQYLDERPIPDIAEDWFPAFVVELYESKERMRERILKREEMKNAPFTGESLDEAIRFGIVEAWRLGGKHYFKRVSEQNPPHTDIYRWNYEVNNNTKS